MRPKPKKSMPPSPTNPMAPSIFPFLFVLVFVVNVRAHGSTFGLKLHHRFSDKVRNWTQSLSLDAEGWPQEGTSAYYAALVAHDQARLRGRGLSDITFAGGNETTKFEYLAFLHYAEVELGTPGVTFLVALDSGSDLSWVPCNCRNCAPTSDDHLNRRFNIFNSDASSTCKRVPCSSSLCSLHETCSTPTDHCPFKVSYVDNSSTSGFLLKDMLHLTDDIQQKPLQEAITFGCGQHQPETFERSTPNGLLGLGMNKISVPTTLHDAGRITTNSFSMCFSHDGHGRIRFGDNGSPDQNTTPFSSKYALYFVTVTEILVQGHALSASFDAFFDTGCSFTILKDPVYSILTQQFDKEVNRDRASSDSQLPFEFCYRIGWNEQEISIPTIHLVMKGGRAFDLLHPVYIYEDRGGNRAGFCLGIIKNFQYDIIGQNFMTGYKIVFDRDNSALGWQETDCYKDEGSGSSGAPTYLGVDSRDSDTSTPTFLSQSILLTSILLINLLLV